MPEFQLGVRFGATGIPDVTKSITELQAQLKRFQAGLNQAVGVDSIARLNRAILETQNRVKGLQGFTGATNNAFTGLRKGANEGAFALQNLGRVAQDVPFGFIGIQNNLNPLLESFQRLKTETGSSGAALKALGSSLVGVGGIGLALSVVSAAILIFQNGIQGFNRKTKEAADKTKEFIDSLKDASDITGQAFGSVQGDIAKVQALANVITDANQPLKLRKRALEELHQVNKEQFGDLTLEESKLKLVTARVNEYTQALIQAAVVKGFSEEISRVSTELSKQEKVLGATKTKMHQAADELDRFKKGQLSTSELLSRTTNKGIGAELVLRNNVLSATEEFTKQRDVVETLSTAFATLTGDIQKAVNVSLAGIDLTGGKKDLKEENDTLSKRIALLEKIKETLKDIDAIVKISETISELKIQKVNIDVKKGVINKDEARQAIDSINHELGEVFQQQADSREAIKIKPHIELERADLEADQRSILTKQIEDNIEKSFSKPIELKTILDVAIKFKIKPLIDSEKTKADVQKLMDDANKQLKSVIENSLVSGLSDVGKGIGEALVGGGFQDAIKPFVNSVASLLEQVGQLAIKAGVEMLLLKKAFKFFSSNPVALIAAGVALEIAASAIKASFFKSLPGAAEGGILRGPKSGFLALLHGEELVTPINKVNNLNLNGSGDIILLPSLEVRGDRVRIMLNKVDERKRRTG